MDVSIACEGWFGLDWPPWRGLAGAVERLGFAGLYLSDRIFLGVSPPLPSLALIVAPTYLADHTARVRFGALVAPLSVREPVTLARQAAALDDLSGGRFVLGVGTGWNAGEHAMFGHALGDLPTRFARPEEGLEVLTRLLRGDGPASYAGHFFRLQDAILAPRPQRPGGPPLLIGGHGPRRTLPLVARYADIWNVNTRALPEVRERAALLDRLLLAAGRRPEDVRRTVPVVLDHGEVQQCPERATREVVEVQADGVGGRLGLDPGTQAAEGLRAVLLEIELADQPTINRLDDLPRAIDRQGQRLGQRLPLVLALGVRRVRSLRAARSTCNGPLT